MQQNQHGEGKSLFEVLGLSSPETDEDNLVVRRVVVVGDAFSGKRTLVSRLFAAAVQQFPSSSVLLLSPIAECTEGQVGGNNISPGLQNPLERSTFPDGTTARPRGSDLPSGVSFDSTVASRFKTDHDAKCVASFPHGVGIAHSFLFQRLPAGWASLVGSVDDCSVNNSVNSTGLPKPSIARGVADNILTEYFCCDSPGALFAALPTVLTLETSVVLVVVDGSTPWLLHEQIQRWYSHLRGHVAQLLRAELPKQDEIRCVRMIEQQRQFWDTQQRVLSSLRNAWCGREGGTVNEEMFPITAGSDVCPLRTLLVCTKTDLLEKLSRDIEKEARPSNEVTDTDKALGGSPACHPSEEQLLAFQASWATEKLHSILHTTGLTLLQLVGQLLRKEAMKRRCGLVGTGSTVNTTTTATTTSASVEQGQHFRGQMFQAPAPNSGPVRSTTGMQGNGGVLATALESSYSTFVHPFYKSLWSFLFYMLYETYTPQDRMVGVSMADSQFTRPSLSVESDYNERAVQRSLVLTGDIDWHVSALFHPYAFLPHGIDHASLLSLPVASEEGISLQSIFSCSFGNNPYRCDEGAGCEGEVDGASIGFRIDYIRRIESIFAVKTGGVDGTA